MKEINIDIRHVTDKEELHKAIKQGLNFPEYYGKNLDALHDSLTDITEPTQVVFTGIRNCKSASDEMSEYVDKLVKVMQDAGEESDNLKFIFMEDGTEGEIYRSMGESNMVNRVICDGANISVEDAFDVLGIGEGDSVIISGFADKKLIKCLDELKIKAIPVDISPETYGIEPRLIDFAIGKAKEDSVKLKSIVVSQPFGIPENIDLIEEIAEENGLSVILTDKLNDDPEVLEWVNRVADAYKLAIQLRFGKGSTKIWTPKIPLDVKPDWLGYPVRFSDSEAKYKVVDALAEIDEDVNRIDVGLDPEDMASLSVTQKLSETAIVLPIRKNIEGNEVVKIVDTIWEAFGNPDPEEDLNPFSDIQGAGPSVRTV